MFQNFNEDHLCIGSYKCKSKYPKELKFVSFVFGVAITLGWTWVLNYICSKGHTGVSWFLVLLPYLFLFLAFFFLVIAGVELEKIH